MGQTQLNSGFRVNPEHPQLLHDGPPQPAVQNQLQPQQTQQQQYPTFCPQQLNQPFNPVIHNNKTTLKVQQQSNRTNSLIRPKNQLARGSAPMKNSHKQNIGASAQSNLALPENQPTGHQYYMRAHSSIHHSPLPYEVQQLLLLDNHSHLFQPISEPKLQLLHNLLTVMAQSQQCRPKAEEINSEKIV